MKLKILFLALFGLALAGKTFAQGGCESTNGCSPTYAAFEFVGITTSGCTICIINTCNSTNCCCCYSIPVCSGIQYLCLDGTTNADGEGGCTALTDASFSAHHDDGSPCYKITVRNDDGTNIDSYYLYNNSGTMEVLNPDPNGSTWATGGSSGYDITVQWDSDNDAWKIQQDSGAPSIDAQGQRVHFP